MTVNSFTPQEAPEVLVRLRGLSKSFGDVPAVRPLDFDINRGTFLAILGPSGCGKTTLLRMIGGFILPTTGTVEIDGHDVTRLAPERRPTNMVFQGFGLFPHMTVRQNIAYGLRVAKRPRAEIDKRVIEALQLVRLEEFADRPVKQLSGGQQQRVALARALIMRPEVLLLDEPLGSLDLKLRHAMQEELRRIHHQIGGTFVFVTHDQSEALGLADRIAVMEEGQMMQDGHPREIYSEPTSRFVSSFIGEANELAGHRLDGRISLEAGGEFAAAGPEGSVVIVVRPEKVTVGIENLETDISLSGTLLDVVFLGSFIKYSIRLDGGEEIAAQDVETDTNASFKVGQQVRIGWRYRDQRVFEI